MSGRSSTDELRGDASLAKEPIADEIDTPRADAFLRRALAAHEEGRADAVYEDARRALLLDRNAALGHFLMASALASLGDAARALRAVRRALRTLAARELEERVSSEADSLTVGELVAACQQLAASLERQEARG